MKSWKGETSLPFLPTPTELYVRYTFQTPTKNQNSFSFFRVKKELKKRLTKTSINTPKFITSYCSKSKHENHHKLSYCHAYPISDFS